MPDPGVGRPGRPDRPPPGKPALSEARPDLVALIGDLIAEGPRHRPPLIGISGSQGSGKTTLAKAAAEAFGAVQLSLDDVYLTRAERAAMARAVHPLFAVRGGARNA